MTANLPAIVALSVGLTMAAGIWWASRHHATRRDTAEARALALAVQDEEHAAQLDDLMDLADAVAVHPQCRRWHRAGFRSHVHRACLDQLDREEAR
jgi:hypothetical protein